MKLNRDLVSMLIQQIKVVADQEDHEEESSSSGYDIDALLAENKTPEWSAMMNSFDRLGNDEVAELHALMLIGRGDLDPKDWGATVACLAHHDKDETVSYMLDKRYLAKYLSAGLNKINRGS